MNKKNILKRIKKIIEENNLSNSEFAEKIGIPKSSVTHLLSERNNPSLDIIIKISEAFENISTDYLIFGQENQVKATIQHSNTLFNELYESFSEDSVKDSNNKVKSIILIYENNKFEQIDNLKD
ncbi:helix-turn-helix domain-containing protein [Flavobacteriaceae bacterium]|nr:helix-turn-helix domain-containing protein [Flavobacteriaceae bacterium]